MNEKNDISDEQLQLISSVINWAANEHGDHVPVAGLGETESHPDTYVAEYVLKCIDSAITEMSAQKTWNRIFEFQSLCGIRWAWNEYRC